MNEQDQNDLQELELSLEHAQGIADFGQQIGTLERNRSFQTVVLDGYFMQEASRLTMLLASNISAEAKLDCIDALKGIAHFRKFLMDRRSMGKVAEREIAVYSETADEIRAGEGA